MNIYIIWDKPKENIMSESLDDNKIVESLEEDLEDDMTAWEIIRQAAVDQRIQRFIDMTEETDIVSESLTVAQRRKKAMSMKRNKAKVAVGRRKAAKKMANMSVLKKRATKAARGEMAKKLTKGIPKGKLSAARKSEIEKRLKKMKPRINRMVKRMLPVVRKREITRKRGAAKK